MRESDTRAVAAGRAAAARHGRLPSRRPVLAVMKFLASTVAVVLVSGLLVGGYAVWRLSSNIETVDLVLEEGEEEVAPPPQLGTFEGGFNLLLVGSDKCEKEGGCKDREANLNDVTMLLHVAADQSSAVAVSFPRDLVVPIPSCPREDGSGNNSAMSARPINETLFYGGLTCTVLTVEKLTGVDIPYAGLITFNGVIQMSSAVGGVPVCISGPIRDKYTGLNLPAAGEYPLAGQDALNFLRSRHGVGDGGDLGRISSQQVFLSSLVRTVKSDSTLTDVRKLFGLATAATSNMTLSSSLGDLAHLNTMVAMAMVLKDIPLEKITFVQYPAGSSSTYGGKLAPIKSQATALFDKIRTDQPFLVEGTGVAAEAAPGTTPELPAASQPPVSPAPVSPAPVDPSASAVPVPAVPEVLAGVTGQTAADQTCTKPYSE